MTQLKHRIAIGTITSGKWKFDHYAGFTELKTLRVNQDGAVERAFFGYGDGASGNIYGIVWQDVSDTHRIEWGCAMYFENNIYRAKKHVSIGMSGWIVPKDTNIFIYHRYNGFYVIFMDGTGMRQIDINTHNKWSDCFELIGNIHENPELLEAGK